MLSYVAATLQIMCRMQTHPVHINVLLASFENSMKKLQKEPKNVAFAWFEPA